MKTIKRRRIEIIAFERERIIERPWFVACPICGVSTEMLTTRQAGEMVQIKPQSIRRWLARGQAHGVRTSGGPYRVCRNSLFVVKEYITPDQPQREDDFDDDRSLTFEGFHLLPPEPTR